MILFGILFGLGLLLVACILAKECLDDIENVKPTFWPQDFES